MSHYQSTGSHILNTFGSIISLSLAISQYGVRFGHVSEQALHYIVLFHAPLTRFIRASRHADGYSWLNSNTLGLGTPGSAHDCLCVLAIKQEMRDEFLILLDISLTAC